MEILLLFSNPVRPNDWYVLVLISIYECSGASLCCLLGFPSRIQAVDCQLTPKQVLCSNLDRSELLHHPIQSAALTSKHSPPTQKEEKQILLLAIDQSSRCLQCLEENDIDCYGHQQCDCSGNVSGMAWCRWILLSATRFHRSTSSLLLCSHPSPRYHQYP